LEHFCTILVFIEALGFSSGSWKMAFPVFRLLEDFSVTLLPVFWPHVGTVCFHFGVILHHVGNLLVHCGSLLVLCFSSGCWKLTFFVFRQLEDLLVTSLSVFWSKFCTICHHFGAMLAPSWFILALVGFILVHVGICSGDLEPFWVHGFPSGCWNLRFPVFQQLEEISVTVYDPFRCQLEAIEPHGGIFFTPFDIKLASLWVHSFLSSFRRRGGW
jgi:hypothetical protein